MKKIMPLLLFFMLSAPVLAGDPHHAPESGDYSINKIIKTYGLAAIHAANQIHPSENVSGLQLGGGMAQVNGRTGGALGAAFNFKGLGLVSGSIAKEGKETIWGAGFNMSIKP